MNNKKNNKDYQFNNIIPKEISGGKLNNNFKKIKIKIKVNIKGTTKVIWNM
jgi:hypothetical protein